MAVGRVAEARDRAPHVDAQAGRELITSLTVPGPIAAIRLEIPRQVLGRKAPLLNVRFDRTVKHEVVRGGAGGCFHRAAIGAGPNANTGPGSVRPHLASPRIPRVGLLAVIPLVEDPLAVIGID